MPQAQIEKLVPQPQDEVALGFLILKDWPDQVVDEIDLGTIQKTLATPESISAIAPARSITRSSSAGPSVEMELVLEARTAAAVHGDAEGALARLPLQ